MVQSGIKSGLFSRFKRGSVVKLPAEEARLEDPKPSPAKRLFAFSPTKAPPSARKTQRDNDHQDGELIPASHACVTSPPISATDVGDSNIKVVVRVRPRNDREASMGGAICVQSQNSSSLRLIPPAEPHSFAYDHVAGETSSQQDMYAVAGREIVDNCLRGFNGCLFAYGQTGSGKTYSMMGGEQSGAVEDDSRGLIQRIFEHIFEDAETQVGIIYYLLTYIFC